MWGCEACEEFAATTVQLLPDRTVGTDVVSVCWCEFSVSVVCSLLLSIASTEMDIK